MAKIGEKIKEAVGSVDNLSKFKKFSKLKASYVEYDKFNDSNLHEGYFCFYWISASGGKCMLVEDSGPDVLGKVSDVIAPHGCCAGYEANYDKLHDTRPDAEDPEKNKEKKTTGDVT